MTVYRIIRHTSDGNCQVFSSDNSKAQMTRVALNRSSVNSHTSYTPMNSNLAINLSNGGASIFVFCYVSVDVSILKKNPYSARVWLGCQALVGQTFGF